MASATGANNVLTIDATSASGYTGNFVWIGSSSNIVALDFGSALTFGGGLVANDSNSRISLDQDVTFASVTLNGVSLAADTYTLAELEAIAPTIFNDVGSGSITVVPEPGTALCFLGGIGVLLSARRRVSSRQLAD